MHNFNSFQTSKGLFLKNCFRVNEVEDNTAPVKAEIVS